MQYIFDKERLPPILDEFLRQSNPWWEGKPGPTLPSYRRWAFRTTLRKLDHQLTPITVVRGPRQVGKTTLQRQLIQHLIETGTVKPQQIFRIQFDELPALLDLPMPIHTLSRWFENRVLGMSFNEAAAAGTSAYLFFDEVQNLADWAPQLKSLVDNCTVKILVTGSSALRIEAGRDSLAGRISSIEMGTLLLREIAGIRFGAHLDPYLPDNGLEPLLNADFWKGLGSYASRLGDLRDQAFDEFSSRGSYPTAQARHAVPWSEMADQLNETVIRRAIQHDLRMGRKGIKRDAHLLEEVYRLACRYAGQAPGSSIFVHEIHQSLAANIGWQRILTYLKFLDGALLLKLIRPMELRLKRTKGNNKVCLCDHGLRASWLQEQIPLSPKQLDKDSSCAEIAGHLAESIVGYFLSGLPNLDLAHFPARNAEPEVDYVMILGDKRIPIEIKYRRRIDPLRDTVGLRAFLEKTVYNAPFGLLITMGDVPVVRDPRIVCLSLSSMLFLR